MPMRWQLRQMFMKQGAHLPKREKATFYPNYSSNFEKIWGMRGGGWHRPFSDKPVLGNLPNDQYRYFQGCKAIAATYSKCRTCEGAFTTEAQRLAHVRNGNCMRIFNDALIIWLGNKRNHSAILLPCAVCGDQTLHRKWGIPLCVDVQCYEAWMFDVVVPPTLKSTITQVLCA